MSNLTDSKKPSEPVEEERWALEDVPTKQLVAELSGREGVEVTIAEPYQDAEVKVNGPAIQNYIAQLQAEQSRRTGVSADRVVRELAKIAFVNAGDLIDPETASVKLDASRDDLAAVQSIKVKTFGEDGLEHEVKLADKLRALDLLGRHLGMFSNSSGDSTEQLNEAKKILEGVSSAID